MEGCFVEFSSNGDSMLLRTIECVNLVAALKRDGILDDEHLADEFSAAEMSYFWSPTPEEMRDWNAHWFSIPVPERHSPKMPTPGWDYGSMVDAIAGAEFALTGVATEQGRSYLTFEPFSYTFGGTGCLVALLECLGNSVSAVNDGTGIVPYVPPPRWHRTVVGGC
jgi:hypothetical protein